MEYDDYYGVVYAALGVGHAPEGYAQSEAAKAGVARLLRYFEKTPAPDLHHKTYLLWASLALDGLMDKTERERTLKALLALQREDGGCGQCGGFGVTGEFFNVQTDTLDMHIRWKELAAVFAVEKPGHLDGTATRSIQFFDQTGAAAFKVFLNFGGPIPPEREAQFVNLRAKFKL